MRNAPPSTVILMGIQGSGKGTQAEKLSTDPELNYQHFVMSDALRKAAQENPEIKHYQETGQLVPHEVVMRVFEEVWKQRNGYRMLLDGFPRSIQQKQGVDLLLPQDAICIKLDIPEEVAMERMAGRGRADDQNMEAVRNRLKGFHEQTKPVIDAFDKEGKLIVIDGLQPPDQVYAQIKAHLLPEQEEKLLPEQKKKSFMGAVKSFVVRLKSTPATLKSLALALKDWMADAIRR